MRAIVQRVKSSKVMVKGETIAEIKTGLNILIGFGQEDEQSVIRPFVEKVVNLRIMPDEQGKMNKSILESGGEILLVSQFTLYADTNGGRRPSFIKAAAPEKAHRLYQNAIDGFVERGLSVKTGRFGEYMTVFIENDGPVTIILDSSQT